MVILFILVCVFFLFVFRCSLDISIGNLIQALLKMVICPKSIELWDIILNIALPISKYGLGEI